MPFEKGYTPWSKGLTKETDERLRRLSENHKGKHHTEETRRKISEANKDNHIWSNKPHPRGMLGKVPWNKNKTGLQHCTEETKIKMSKAHIGCVGWKNGLTKETDERIRKHSEALKGRHNTEESKRKVRENAKTNPNYGMKGKHFSEESKKKISEARLNQIFPTKDTSIELNLQEELSRRGLAYSKHFPIIGQPDIAFPDRKIAVFADGDYWHNLPNQKEKDARVTEKLRSDGWLVLRYWEHEINTNIGAVVDEIEELIIQSGGDEVVTTRECRSPDARTGAQGQGEMERSGILGFLPLIEAFEPSGIR